MNKQDMVDLLIKFLSVKERGYVKTLRKGSTGIGYTFETLIGKKEESFPIPDFRSIEIKVKKQYGKGGITLFNAVPDNEVFATRRLYEEYGALNKNMNYNKTFMLNVNSINYTKYGRHYFKLKVDYDNRLIRLLVEDLDHNLIDNTASWSFDSIESKIYGKIKCLAIVKAKEKIIDSDSYYFYYHIGFYEIKSAKRFFELVDNGIIDVTFKVSTYLKGIKYGEMNNHGTGFNINIKNLLDLYYLRDFEKKTTNSRI